MVLQMVRLYTDRRKFLSLEIGVTYVSAALGQRMAVRICPTYQYVVPHICLISFGARIRSGIFTELIPVSSTLNVMPPLNLYFSNTSTRF